jgi:hypothetical protein
MAKLTTEERNKIPESEFALPGRRYPVEDKNHAEAARSRISHNGTPEEKKRVFSKTAKFFR